MIRTKALALAMMALLLAAVTALAQPTDDGADPQQPAAADSRPTTTDATIDKPGQPGDSPSDYRASEKISEDLPVSFPIDI